MRKDSQDLNNQCNMTDRLQCVTGSLDAKIGLTKMIS